MRYGVRSATVLYGRVLALDDVSFSVATGEVVAVVGGDGAGKTTLLRTLVGEAPLQRGEVTAPAPRAIGYLPSSAGSWPALTVRENVDFAAGAYGSTGAGLADRRTRLLERAGLRQAEDRLASQLSGGMRRKLGFVMASLHRPALLVLDEPSTGVDPVSRVDLWRLIAEAAADGTAVVMSTTYLDEAERASSLLVLDEGSVLARGSLDEVRGELRGAVTESAEPTRRPWAWRRGRRFHELWPEGTPPAGSRVLDPDLEDVVIGMSLVRRSARTSS